MSGRLSSPKGKRQVSFVLSKSPKEQSPPRLSVLSGSRPTEKRRDIFPESTVNWYTGRIENCVFSGFKEDFVEPPPNKISYEPIANDILRHLPITSPKWRKSFAEMISNVDMRNLVYDAFWWFWMVYMERVVRPVVMLRDGQDVFDRDGKEGQGKNAAHLMKKPQRDEEARVNHLRNTLRLLFNRMSKSYVQAFLSHTALSRDEIFALLPDVLSNLTFCHFFHCFPLSRQWFDKLFQKSISRRLFYWITGMVPESPAVDHWQTHTRLGEQQPMPTMGDAKARMKKAVHALTMTNLLSFKAKAVKTGFSSERAKHEERKKLKDEAEKVRGFLKKREKEKTSQNLESLKEGSRITSSTSGSEGEDENEKEKGTKKGRKSSSSKQCGELKKSPDLWELTTENLLDLVIDLPPRFRDREREEEEEASSLARREGKKNFRAYLQSKSVETMTGGDDKDGDDAGDGDRDDVDADGKQSTMSRSGGMWSKSDLLHRLRSENDEAWYEAGKMTTAPLHLPDLEAMGIRGLSGEFGRKSAPTAMGVVDAIERARKDIIPSIPSSSKSQFNLMNMSPFVLWNLMNRERSHSQDGPREFKGRPPPRKVASARDSTEHSRVRKCVEPRKIRVHGKEYEITNGSMCAIGSARERGHPVELPLSRGRSDISNPATRFSSSKMPQRRPQTSGGESASGSKLSAFALFREKGRGWGSSIQWTLQRDPFAGKTKKFESILPPEQRKEFDEEVDEDGVDHSHSPSSSPSRRHDHMSDGKPGKQSYRQQSRTIVQEQRRRLERFVDDMKRMQEDIEEGHRLLELIDVSAPRSTRISHIARHPSVKTSQGRFDTIPIHASRLGGADGSTSLEKEKARFLRELHAKRQERYLGLQSKTMAILQWMAEAVEYDESNDLYNALAMYEQVFQESDSHFSNVQPEYQDIFMEFALKYRVRYMNLRRNLPPRTPRLSTSPLGRMIEPVVSAQSGREEVTLQIPKRRKQRAVLGKGEKSDEVGKKLARPSSRSKRSKTISATHPTEHARGESLDILDSL
eukprot:TRINITY_DN267_c1_g3_i1.p1 TRINITY_DN267_c1_g3~~TRINITY_DN267_c1_g3_i1.p1  ORF type:complete len:1068 (-),score=324.81 TRINITY_DN267_c1_g3_i1:81-3176(-)